MYGILCKRRNQITEKTKRMRLNSDKAAGTDLERGENLYDSGLKYEKKVGPLI